MPTLHQLLELVRSYPPVERRRAARYRRAFESDCAGWPRFCGKFDSREQALEAISGSRMRGYDHAEVVDVNLDNMMRVWTADYPVIYWLSRAIPPAAVLFDLGGHVGTKFRAWSSYLAIPPEFRWIICDVPAMVERGRQMAGQDPVLHFTTDRTAADGADILLASGVLQYMDGDLSELIRPLARPPMHLLLNKVPCRDGADAYTMENLRVATVPYRIFDDRALLERLRSLGYSVRDQWMVNESQVRVPFTDLGEPQHRGFYLRRDA